MWQNRNSSFEELQKRKGVVDKAPAEERGVSTEEVQRHLQRSGLRVTRTMLDNDVHDDYLPPRPWPVWVLRRAERLYRLRARGLKGDVLRLLLFARDGKQWESIAPVVVAGFKRCTKSMQVGIKDTVRNPTSKAMETLLPEVVERHHEHLIERIGPERAAGVKTQPSTMAFAWGMGLFGKPLEGGSLISMEPLMRAMNPQWDAETTTASRELTEETFAALGLTWEKQISILESVDEAKAAAALPTLWRYIRDQRTFVHRLAVKDGKQKHCTNPLSIFGYFEQSKNDGFWDNMPERLTPAQALGAQIGIVVIAKVAMDNSLFGAALNLMQALMDEVENNPVEQ